METVETENNGPVPRGRFTKGCKPGPGRPKNVPPPVVALKSALRVSAHEARLAAMAIRDQVEAWRFIIVDFPRAVVEQLLSELGLSELPFGLAFPEIDASTSPAGDDRGPGVDA